MNGADDAKRLVMRVVLLQAACGALVAALFWMMQGAAAARWRHLRAD